ncbi:MAG TPA: efflux transporter outer membrane subunit [Rhodocyclaceae bacterium]|nr:efflux transporter outer membrane subunit [Rhodocyclaceae bacterium]
MKLVARYLCLVAIVILTACAVQLPANESPTGIPSLWSTPPISTSETRLAQLNDWWSQFDDPLLPALIHDAQNASPQMAQALARVAEARALARQAGAARAPSANGSASIERSKQTDGLKEPAFTDGQLSIDASWELDIFGGLRHAADAAATRAQAASLQWYDARISLAAEVAQDYVNFRNCEALANVLDEESAAQDKLAELTQLKVKAGFESPANGALANAAQADVNSQRIAQHAACEVALSQLSVVSAQDVPALRPRLSSRAAQLPRPAAFQVSNVPAEVLAQRPDIAASERELRAAAYDVGVADADRYPQLTLNGSIGLNFVPDIHGNATTLPFWSIGPTLTLPLFDAGRRQAALDAARARLAQAQATHEGRLRTAVGEVEQAIIQLNSASQREADAARSVAGYREFLNATDQLWRLGGGSEIDLENARRQFLTAQSTLLDVQREHVGAWITLYKAIGGGWSGSDKVDTASNATIRTSK